MTLARFIVVDSFGRALVVEFSTGGRSP